MPLCDPLEPEMIEVRPGLLTQGDERLPIDGQLRRIVMIETAFAIGKYPVTFDEFDRYANSFDEHVRRMAAPTAFPASWTTGRTDPATKVGDGAAGRSSTLAGTTPSHMPSGWA